MGRDHPRGRTQAGLGMRRARLQNGVELHYVERGRGRPLVLLHGGMGDLASWSSQLAAFSRFHRVIAYSRRYNFPNRNGAPVPCYGAHVDAEDLAALLDHLRLDAACLVGTSYGAYVALALALRHPQRVERLVLVEPPVHRCAPATIFNRFIADVWRPAARAFERGETARALLQLTDGMWGEPVFERLPRSTLRVVRRNARAMKALTSSSDPFPRLSRRQLRRLRVPVLLVAGQHAAPIHSAVNGALARILPRAREAIIPRASHGSPRENPTAFNRVVLKFLGRAA